MSKPYQTAIFGILTLFWVLGLTYLLYSTTHPLQWISLLIIAIVSFLIMVYLFKIDRQQHRLNEQIRLHHVFAATLSEVEEAVVFDEHGRTIFTTHPHLYPHQREFLRKFLLKVKSSPEKHKFKKWVEEHLSGEIILSGGGDGLGQQENRWLVRIHAVNPTHVNGKNMILISIVDLTRYLGGIQKAKENHQQLEMFLDNAPFAFFYASKTQHFLAANQTLANWLQKDKNKLIGSRIQDFIPEFSVIEGDERTRTITIKINDHKSIKALYFPPSNHGKKSEAGILCRLDDGIITTQTIADDFMSEASFCKSKIPAIVLKTSGEIINMNPAFGSLILDSVVVDENVQTIGSSFYDLLETIQKEAFQTNLDNLLKTKEETSLLEVVFKDKKYHATAHISVLEDHLNEKSAPKFYIQFIDISEQTRLKEQFTQSQKMQAVGQLAGGIAHDFNNLLTAMIGYCDLLLQRHLPNDSSYKDVIQIKQNAERASNLVRQLLAFSRQQSLQPKVIKVTEILSELSALLRRLIGVNIDFDINHGRGLSTIRADISQIEQVIVNLVVNARDAIGENSGSISIKTYNYACVRKQHIGHSVMPKGEYVAIEIQDTGSGIPESMLESVFEPFFSTKEVGEGTGLGLSTVYGIMQQSQGFVEVKSTVGEGTTFTLYFPEFKEDPKPVIEKKEKQEDLLGGGSLMLVEDEDSVRMFCARALREKGYEVIEAENGESALKLIREGHKFDVLITDVVMPKMDGPTLNKKVRDILPNTKTIFISGYAEDTFRKDLDSSEQIHFLSKPFSLKDLASKVKSVIQS